MIFVCNAEKKSDERNRHDQQGLDQSGRFHERKFIGDQQPESDDKGSAEVFHGQSKFQLFQAVCQEFQRTAQDINGNRQKEAGEKRGKAVALLSKGIQEQQEEQKAEKK